MRSRPRPIGHGAASEPPLGVDDERARYDDSLPWHEPLDDLDAAAGAPPGFDVARREHTGRAFHVNRARAARFDERVGRYHHGRGARYRDVDVDEHIRTKQCRLVVNLEADRRGLTGALELRRDVAADAPSDRSTAAG